MSENSDDLEPLPAEKLCNRWGEGNPIHGDGALGNEKTGKMYHIEKDRKKLVITLQKMLITLEYNLGTSGPKNDGVDGKFEGKTEEAVLDFQKNNTDWEGEPLKIDGLVGPETSDALNRAMVGKKYDDKKWHDHYQTPVKLTSESVLLTATAEALENPVTIEIENETKGKVIIVGEIAGDSHNKNERPPHDNPELRHRYTVADRRFTQEDKKKQFAHQGIEEDVESPARLRLVALEHAETMPTTENTFEKEVDMIGSVQRRNNWVQMGPMTIPEGQTHRDARVRVTGRVTSMVIDPKNPDIIYVGAAQGGVWKTVDGGARWVPKSDYEKSLAIGAIAIDCDGWLYAGTGEGNFSHDSYYGCGVLRTKDGGDTWELFGEEIFEKARFCRIAIPQRTSIIFAATSQGIFRSMYKGESWHLMENGLPEISEPSDKGRSAYGATDVVIDPLSPKTVYVAFWGKGIYKSDNANEPTPLWTELKGGLPSSGFSRIALAISPSKPSILYALMADQEGNLINRFYRSIDSGTNWNQINIPNGDLGVTDETTDENGNPIRKRRGQGHYNLDIAVDPDRDDIVYFCGVSLWKGVINPNNIMVIKDIGGIIHADNHTIVLSHLKIPPNLPPPSPPVSFDPEKHRWIYVGNDGGIYKSENAGDSWDDSINKLCITQFEFIDNHPTSDAVVIGGTQDNGTEQFRNSPVFYHSDDGDGGYVAIDPSNPNNVLHTFYDPTLVRSEKAGKFKSWTNVRQGLEGTSKDDPPTSLFYPPFALDKTNSMNIALGTNKIHLDNNQGRGGWTKIELLGLKGLVSAINYVNSMSIFVGTDHGQVYILTIYRSGWTPIEVRQLPENDSDQKWIWDIATQYNNAGIVFIVMGGFKYPHVWRASMSGDWKNWVNISGNLPDTPVNAIAVSPSNIVYIGTDTGVFFTQNPFEADGSKVFWYDYNCRYNNLGYGKSGLPISAVLDLRIHEKTGLLRAATHGRGLWETNLWEITGSKVTSDICIFVRNNIMDTGRVIPWPSGVVAAFEDTRQHVNLGDQVEWFQCADIKIDAKKEGFVLDVKYVLFESKLEHCSALRGRTNRVYVQVHNRGTKPAKNVKVKILYADTSSGYPDLPSDFWTAFPDDSMDTSQWIPIDEIPILNAKIIDSLSHIEPEVLEWDWNTPPEAANDSCLLVIIDCDEDPIPEKNKLFQIEKLVRNERHVGLRKITVMGNAQRISISAEAFNDEGTIPAEYTCDRSNISPELEWHNAPSDTKSFALIVDDQDAETDPLITGSASFVHWVIFNIPAPKRKLEKGIPKTNDLTDNSHQGTNSFGRIGYDGPCTSDRHRYYFQIYALDRELDLPGGATKRQVQEAMAGHILADGVIMGRYRN